MISLKSVTKDTLKNIGLQICAGAIGAIIAYSVAEFVCNLIFNDEDSPQERLAAYESHCPDGYVEWELREFFPFGKTERNGDSLLMFEKHRQVGCRPFKAGSKVTEAVETSKRKAHAASKTYHSSITGAINLKTGELVGLDTSRWTVPIDKQIDSEIQ